MSMRCTIRMILLLSGVITSTLAFQTLKNTIHPRTTHSNDNNYDSQLVQPSFVVASVQRPFITTTITSKVRLYAATMEDETTTSNSQNSNNKSGTGKEVKQQQQHSLGDRIASSSMASAAAVATAAGMYLYHRSID